MEVNCCRVRAACLLLLAARCSRVRAACLLLLAAPAHLAVPSGCSSHLQAVIHTCSTHSAQRSVALSAEGVGHCVSPRFIPHRHPSTHSILRCDTIRPTARSARYRLSATGRHRLHATHCSASTTTAWTTWRAAAARPAHYTWRRHSHACSSSTRTHKQQWQSRGVREWGIAESAERVHTHTTGR